MISGQTSFEAMNYRQFRSIVAALILRDARTRIHRRTRVREFSCSAIVDSRTCSSGLYEDDNADESVFRSAIIQIH